LNELDFDHKENMLLIVYNQEDDFYNRSERFALEKTGEAPRERGVLYPQVAGMSKALKAFKLMKSICEL